MYATFVLSTGRCGTQWLTEKLQALYPDAVVEHEPLSFNYRPDVNTERAPLQCNKELIMQHLSCIQHYLDQGKPYIETGFPCWRHLEWFKQQLGGRVKIIHVHREPLQTVSSLLKLNAFVPPFIPQLPIKNLFLPEDGYGYFKDWQHLWPHLNPAEKNLWYWGEVQAHALLLQAQWPAADWLQLEFSTLFGPQAEARLIHFLGDTPYAGVQPPGHVDQYGHALVPYPLEFPLMERLPAINHLAGQCGYGAIFPEAVIATR